MANEKANENTPQVGENALQLTMSHPTPSSGVLRPVISLEEVKTVWADYLELENILLDDKDYLYFVIWQVGQKEQRVACASLQVAETTRKKTHGRIERTKKKSAYRKMSVFFNLTIPQREGTPEIEMHEMSAGVVKIERGDGYIGTLYMKKPPIFDVVRAEFAITVTAPNGRAVVGHGACSASERGFTHPDHDIVATAWTRALNRAISDMIGMGEVSAEELTSDGVVGASRQVVEGKAVKRPVRMPTRMPLRPAKAKPETSETKEPETEAAPETSPVASPVASSDTRPNSGSGPRNLGEFLAAVITGFNITVPEVVEILGVEDLGEIDDWDEALQRVREASQTKETRS